MRYELPGGAISKDTTCADRFGLGCPEGAFLLKINTVKGCRPFILYPDHFYSTRRFIVFSFCVHILFAGTIRTTSVPPTVADGTIYPGRVQHVYSIGK